MSRPNVTLITDGSGTAAIPDGGWACILRYEGNGQVVEKIITGRVQGKTSNIKMEMSAVIAGLSALTRSCDVHLVTDLQMIQGGICTWLGNWVKRGWRKSNGKKPDNLELWKQIYVLTKFHHVTVEWVKGHAGHSDNERVDVLAGKARKGELTNTTIVRGVHD